MKSINNIDDIKKNYLVLNLYKSRTILHKSGAEWLGLCPFHSEKTGSFRISNHQGVLVYKCFGCSASGDIISFIQKFDNIGFKETVEKLKKELGVSNDFDSTKKASEIFSSLSGQDKPAVTYTLEQFAKFEKALDESKEAKDWLQSRGINYNNVKHLHIGFRQDVGKLAGEANQDISNKGWIAFPCISNNKIVSIKYRSIIRKAFCKQGGMAKGEDTPLFNTDSIEGLEPIFLVEGECDAIVLEQAGFHACSVQSASTPLTAPNKEKLLEADYVILAGDNSPDGNAYMDKVWAAIGDRCFKLTWPSPYKDANEVFLDKCGSDIEAFKELVNELANEAKSKPMPGMFSLQEAMICSGRTNMSEHPNRLKFPWSSVDAMVNLVPGTVLLLTATSTGSGKTTFVSQILTHACIDQGKVILNYSAELSCDEYANMVASHLLAKDRNTLTKVDYEAAAKKLSGARFYIGRNPDLNTANEVLDLIEAGIRRFSPDIVVIDHIHYICRNESDTTKSQENAMQRVKRLAAKYGVIFIVVGQPRKASQQTRGKVIQISDLKGSEVFGSDSDAVIIIHRDIVTIDDPNKPPKEPYSPLTQVHLLKGRSQGTGGAYTELMFNGSLCTFYSITKEGDGLFN